MDLLLSSRNLSIGYQKDKPLFNNLNFDFYGGKLIVLIGENGIGKSTFLKTFIKILPPLSGKIFFKNNDLDSISQKDLSKKISVVLTDKLQVENLSVFDVISFGRMPYTNFFGKISDVDKQIIYQVANELKISDFLDKKYHELSDGQKQKTLIAKALVQQTEIIILDEPTAFLDFKSKEEIFVMLKRIAEEKNCLILVSTHDVFSVLQYADFALSFTKNGINYGEISQIIDNDIMFKNIKFDKETRDIIIKKHR